MSFRLCSIENCNSRHKSKGLCEAHYKSQARKGAFDTPDRPSCIMTGCLAVQRYKQMCSKHYQIAQRADMRRLANACAAKPCEGVAYREGHCKEHYLERYPKAQTRIPDCRRPGCTQPQHRLGGCIRHFKMYQPNALRQTLIPCKVEGCQTLAKKNGKCEDHTSGRAFCIEPDCKRKQYSNNLCKLHNSEIEASETYPDDFWAFVKQEMGIKA